MSTRIDASKGRQGIQSVEMAGQVLRALVDGGQPMMLRDLANVAGMAPAKAHRYLVSLIRMGLAEQSSETGHYDLGGFALHLGLASLSRMEPVRVAAAALGQLRDATDETAALSVWGSYGATVVRWEEARRPVTVNLRIGGVLPLLSSATGRAFLAYLPREQTAEAVRAELAAAARNRHAAGPRNAAQVDALVRDIRARGLSRVDGELIPGVAAFAAPVFGVDRRLMLVLTVLGHGGHFDTRWGGPVATRLRETARQLSLRLGASSTIEE